MKIRFPTLAAATLTFVTAISPALARDLVVGLQNWPSASAAAHIIKAAIEKDLGLQVKLQNGTNPIIFEAMDKGSMDIMPEIWLPNQQNLYDKYVAKRGTVLLNKSGYPAEQGICVPDYVASKMAVKSVTDLTDPNKAKLFDTNGDGKGNLWVGNPGDASGNVEKIKAKSFGFDQTMDLDVYDETIAYSKLGTAIKQHKPWIGFCYEPHYIFMLYHLTMLKEPPYDAAKWHIVQPTDDPNWLAKSYASTAWPTAHVYVGYRKALETEYPSVANMLHHIKFTDSEVSAMDYALVVEKKDPTAFAKKWIAAHQKDVLGWFKQ